MLLLPIGMRKAAKALALLLAAAVLALVVVAAWILWMPGRSWRGPRPPLHPGEVAVAEDLERTVRVLAEEIGPRHFERPGSLERTLAWLEAEFRARGLEPQREPFEGRGQTFANLVAEVPGRRAPGEIVVVGAHYDTCGDQPGADDNASGVAGLLAIARAMAGSGADRTLRLVAFANEEPPFFKGQLMGSRVHAEASRARGDRIVGMWSLEMLGYYSDAPGSQEYPWPLGLIYPDRGDFVAMVADHASRAWVHASIRAFRRTATIPSEGIASPFPVVGLDLSDHWSFWRSGYPALMVVDGGPFRNPHYHRPTDLPGTLDFASSARVVRSLVDALVEVLTLRDSDDRTARP